jgi:hypothetical protein
MKFFSLSSILQYRQIIFSPFILDVTSRATIDCESTNIDMKKISKIDCFTYNSLLRMSIYQLLELDPLKYCLLL